MPGVRYVKHALPDFEIPAEVPVLDPPIFTRRYERLERAREAAELDWLVIYADREHSANLAWVSGFDPRFEEALWIQGAGKRPTLLVGNENLGYAPSQLKIPAEVTLYQPFSLPNQDRSKSTDLRALLRGAGLARGDRCGLVGWKPQEVPDAPYWVVRALADATGDEPVNATALLVDPDTGLRVVMEPEMIRFCEYASSLTSSAVRRWVESMREGISERESAANLNSFGLELSCHTMVNFGRPIASGLKSPRNARAVRGEYAQAAFGVTGALTCRAGRLIGGSGGTRAAREHGENAGLSAPITDDDPDEYLALVENYLGVVRAWYRTIRIGTSAGDAVAAAEAVKSDDWDFAVNPGHLIHLDEWVSSPFFRGSTIVLKSGYAIQQDIIPVPRRGPAVLNMEDGFVLADDDLRERLRRLDPPMMARCDRRRAFMEALGYEIAPDIVPLSNIAGVFFPFLLSPDTVAIISS